MTRCRWLEEEVYANLVALCQFLPGPTSNQVGFALRLMLAGWGGALVAFVAFTFPRHGAGGADAAMMDRVAAAGLVHGLKMVSVAVVAQAVWGMALSLRPDWGLGALTAFVSLLVLLPVLRPVGETVALIDSFYRAGFLVFSGTKIGASNARLADPSTALRQE